MCAESVRQKVAARKWPPESGRQKSMWKMFAKKVCGKCAESVRQEVSGRKVSAKKVSAEKSVRKASARKVSGRKVPGRNVAGEKKWCAENARQKSAR